MLNTLIVGLKNRGAVWARAVARHSSFALAGLADVDEQVLAQRGEEFSVPPSHRHRTVEEALASLRYQAAIVVVPNHLHYPVAKAVIEAGVPCLLEKPFADTIQQAEELTKLAEQKQVPLVIAQNYRYKPQYRRAAEVLGSGALGRLASVQAVFHRYRPPRYEHERAMRYPMLFLQGIHHLDWMLSILPAPVVELHAEHRLPAWSEWRSPTMCFLTARCSDGLLASYQGSYESRGEQTPYNGLWRLECERGDLLMDAEQRLWRIDREERRLLCEPANDDILQGDWGLLDAFAAAVLEGQEAPTSARNNLETMRFLVRVIEAGESRR